jgi:hypothetical protein
MLGNKMQSYELEGVIPHFYNNGSYPHVSEVVTKKRKASDMETIFFKLLLITD